MTRKDLSPIMQQAYDALPTAEQRETFLEQFGSMRSQMIRSATSQVIARNFSHHVGTHVINFEKK